MLDKEEGNKYPRSVLSRFTIKVGEDNLNKIMNQKVVNFSRPIKQKKLTLYSMLPSSKPGAQETQSTTKQDT
jgi:hypothetical protein